MDHNSIWVAGRPILFLLFSRGVTPDFDVFLVALDVDKECARDIHKKCAERLVEPNPNLCTSVSNFVDCYGNFIGGLSPLPSSCIGPVPEITNKFNTVIQEFSTYLIKLYKHDPERMCQVDERVLEGDCMTMSVE